MFVTTFSVQTLIKLQSMRSDFLAYPGVGQLRWLGLMSQSMILPLNGIRTLPHVGGIYSEAGSKTKSPPVSLSHVLKLTELVLISQPTGGLE